MDRRAVPSQPTNTWRDTVILAVVCAMAYGLLRQRSLHGLDVYFLLAGLDAPDFVHAQHPGYIPAMRFLRWLLSPVGIDGWPLLCLGSALGGALGVAGLHRAACTLQPGDPGRARFVALLAALTPAVVHFATVAELHAPFFAVAGLSWWAAARCVRSPGRRTGACLGIATALATLMHASGHLLALVLPAFVLWERRLPPASVRPALPAAAVAVATHAVVWTAAFLGLRATGAAAAEDPLSVVAAQLQRVRLPDVLPGAALHEWLLPYAPASLLVFVALRHPPLRGTATLLAITTFGFVVVSATLLLSGVRERGAYLLPLAFPYAALLADALPGRTRPWVLLATAAAAGIMRALPERAAPDLGLARAAATFAAAAPTRFLLGELPEQDAFLLGAPHLDATAAVRERENLRANAVDAAGLDAVMLGAWLDLQLRGAKARGARWFVSDGAAAFLRRELPAFAAAWAKFVADRHPVRVDNGSLRGFVFTGP